MNVSVSEAAREQDLRGQHSALRRGGYDGHNRRSGIVSIHRLRERHRRRHLRQQFGVWARLWEPEERAA